MAGRCVFAADVVDGRRVEVNPLVMLCPVRRGIVVADRQRRVVHADKLKQVVEIIRIRDVVGPHRFCDGTIKTVDVKETRVVNQAFKKVFVVGMKRRADTSNAYLIICRQRERLVRVAEAAAVDSEVAVGQVVDSPAGIFFVTVRHRKRRAAGCCDDYFGDCELPLLFWRWLVIFPDIVFLSAICPRVRF